MISRISQVFTSGLAAGGRLLQPAGVPRSFDLHQLTPVGITRSLLALSALGLVIFLLFGDKPWAYDLGGDRKIKIREYVAVYAWIAALVNLFICCVLALTARVWVQAPRRTPGRLAALRTGPGFWLVVAGAAVFLFVSALPRLGQSLWHDEANRVKNVLVGEYELQDDGSYQLDVPRWRDTFFYYRMPNHILQSVVSRAFHDPWVALGGWRGIPLSEAALRVPLLMAALAGIFLIARFLAGLGFAAGGMLAAWLLALHPWYLRYASEARAYMLVIALLPLLLIALQRAVESGRARYWALFGFVEFAMILSYITSVYILAVLNLGFLLLLALNPEGRIDRLRTLSAWLVATAIAAAFFLQFFLPCLPQLLDYLASEKGRGDGNTMGLPWVQNFLAYLLAGVPWTNTGDVPSRFHELFPWAAVHPGAFALLAAGIPALVGAGTLALWQAGGLAGHFRRLAWATLLVPAPLCYFVSKGTGSYLFEWYLIFLLPGLAAILAIGACALALTPSSRWGKVLGCAALVIGLTVFAFATSPQRSFLRAHSIQPYREAVLATRPSLDPNAPGQDRIITATFHAGPLIYDPRIRDVETPGELEDLMSEADATGSPLFLNLAYPGASAASFPVLQKMADDPQFFEEVEEFPGFDPTLSTRVLRYRPGSLNRTESP